MSVGTADDVLSENFVENETERSTLRVEEEERGRRGRERTLMSQQPREYVLDLCPHRPRPLIQCPF